MLYLTNDGQEFFADNAAQLVRMLREDAFVESDNDKEFMREVAKRVQLQDRRARIATENVKVFVESLVDAGFLERKHG